MNYADAPPRPRDRIDPFEDRGDSTGRLLGDCAAREHLAERGGHAADRAADKP